MRRHHNKKNHLFFPSLSFSSYLFNPCVVQCMCLCIDTGNYTGEMTAAEYPATFILHCHYHKEAQACPLGCNSMLWPPTDPLSEIPASLRYSWSTTAGNMLCCWADPMLCMAALQTKGQEMDNAFERNFSWKKKSFQDSRLESSHTNIWESHRFPGKVYKKWLWGMEGFGDLPPAEEQQGTSEKWSSLLHHVTRLWKSWDLSSLCSQRSHNTSLFHTQHQRLILHQKDASGV